MNVKVYLRKGLICSGKGELADLVLSYFIIKNRVAFESISRVEVCFCDVTSYLLGVSKDSILIEYRFEKSSLGGISITWERFFYCFYMCVYKTKHI